MKTYPITILDSFPAPPEALVKERLSYELRDFHKKIIVLDDDPTGIQTVHGVNVYTDWKKETLTSAFLEDNSLFFLLTNSRSLSGEQTAKLHEEIAVSCSEISRELGREFLMISRGDSTLRGHYPLETEVLKDTFTVQAGFSCDGEIICPFFPEGGRYTFGNVHYVKENNHLVPAGETEFAKDKTFSYHSSDLRDYIEEKSCGKYKSKDCICISIEELRSLSYDSITEKLVAAKNFTKIIVNAVSYTDLKVFATAWLRAMKQGKHFLTRSAAALPKIIGNIPDKPLLLKKDLIAPEVSAGGIIIVGSHVKKTCDQLDCLKDSSLPFTFLEFHVNSYFEPGGLEKEAGVILQMAEEEIKNGRTAVIYTSRKLLAPENAGKEKLLSLSVEISNALTGIVSKLTVKPRFIIAKGGITSSDVGTKGLHVKKALVMGQIKKGIPVWMTGSESKFPGTPYVIFPGNVGESTTLREIAEELAD